MDAERDLSRRTLLGRGFLLTLGALGMKAAEGLAVTPAMAKEPEKTLKVLGTDWRYWPAGEAGGPPAHGERATLTGKLASATGATSGEFCGTSMFVDAAFADSAADASLQFHTFTLPEGTITGMGMAGPGVSAYTVIGGTGRYAGARGTYAGRQSPLELGGDGTAEFTFRLG
jgi:hypothetical protein